MRFNIYDYIYTRELKREYKRLNWNFSYEDMASIIYQSRCDYQKKLKGYDYIIKNTSNEILKEQLNKEIYYIFNYMEQMKNKNKNEVYYQFDNITKESHYFSSYDKAIEYSLLNNKDNDKNYYFTIKKVKKNVKDNHSYKNEIIFNYEGKAVYMNLNYEEDNNFFGYKFVKYPPVFKEYDVVVKEDVYTNFFGYKKQMIMANNQELLKDYFKTIDRLIDKVDNSDQALFYYEFDSNGDIDLSERIEDIFNIRKIKKEEYSLTTKYEIKRIKEIKRVQYNK